MTQIQEDPVESAWNNVLKQDGAAEMEIETPRMDTTVAVPCANIKPSSTEDSFDSIHLVATDHSDTTMENSVEPAPAPLVPSSDEKMHYTGVKQENEEEEEGDLSSEFSFDSLEIGEEFEGFKLQQQENIAEGLDMHMVRQCIENGSPVLEKVNENDVVLVVGKTGVGKSLFMQGVAGKSIVPVLIEEELGGESVSIQVFEAVDPLPGFEVGHAKVSKTKFLTCFERLGSGGRQFVYIDSPGWDDTVGPEVDIATSVMISKVIGLAKSLRVIVLINYASLLEDRRGAMRDIVKLARTFVSDFKKKKRSFMFVFTHTNQATKSSSVETARSLLMEEVLRIMKGTRDDEVVDVLNFIVLSLKKKYGFAEVFDPIETDFNKVRAFIETKLSGIKGAPSMDNCGLTTQSRMKLNGQTQQMLLTLRQLLQRSKDLGPTEGVIKEIKHLRETFKYFDDNVPLWAVEKGLKECEELLQRHLDNQRVLVATLLQKARDEKGHFNSGTAMQLRIALEHIEALSSKRDADVTKASFLDACQVSLGRVTTDTALNSLDITLNELGKMKAWSEHLPWLRDLYADACASIAAMLVDATNKVERAFKRNIEAVGIGYQEDAMCALGTLGRLVDKTSFFCAHDIGMEEYEIILRSVLENISVWAATCVSSSAKAVENWPDQDPAESCLCTMGRQIQSLEEWVAFFQREGYLVYHEVTEAIEASLENISPHMLSTYCQLCHGLFSDAPITADNKSVRLLNVLEQNRKLLCTLNQNRWFKTTEMFGELKLRLQREVDIISADVSSAAKECERHGLQEGSVMAKKIVSIMSLAPLDPYLGASGLSAKQCVDDALSVLRCRKASVFEWSRLQCRDLMLGTPGNDVKLSALNVVIVEMFQFVEFDLALGAEESVVNEEKRMVLAGLKPYRESLDKYSNVGCKVWLDVLKRGDQDDIRNKTQQLDQVLEEIEAIRSFHHLENLRQKAQETKDSIVDACATVTDFLEQYFTFADAYSSKASHLGMLISIKGFSRVGPYLPDVQTIKEKALIMVGEEAKRIEDMMSQSTDDQAIEKALVRFQDAEVLDIFTCGEASNRYRLLASLRQRKTDDTDKLLKDMIDKDDYEGIGKFLRPMASSKGVVQKQKFQNCSKMIQKQLNDRARNATSLLELPPSSESAKVISDALSILSTADKEIGQILTTQGTPSGAFVRPLKKTLNEKMRAYIKRVMDGLACHDFHEIGRNYHSADCLHASLQDFEFKTTTERFEEASSKYTKVKQEIPHKVERFLRSLFVEDGDNLVRVLASLQKCSHQTDDPAFTELLKLYTSTTEELSHLIHERLLGMRDQVNDLGCFDEGIAALKALKKADVRGLLTHLPGLPFNYEKQLEQWEKERLRIFQPCVGDKSCLNQYRKRMDSLAKPDTWTRIQIWKRPEQTLNNLRNQLTTEALSAFNDGMTSLRDDDLSVLKRHTNILKSTKEIVGAHVSVAADKLDELLGAIADKVHVLCGRATNYLGQGNEEDFQCLLPQIRLYLIDFVDVLDNEETAKAFRLLCQVVYDVLKSGIERLHTSIAQLDFAKTRETVMTNRSFGAYLVDHFTLLFEELKQRQKFQNEIWLQRIREIACDSFSAGRDLIRIKSFAILGELPSASAREVRSAFKQKAKQVHPDKTASDDDGESFRFLKDAHDELLKSLESSSAGSSARLCDSIIRAIPDDLVGRVRGWIDHQEYEKLALLLHKLPQVRLICDLVTPPIDETDVEQKIVQRVVEYVSALRVSIDSCWGERQYKELNLNIIDLRQMEKHLKQFPVVFPMSWNQGIIGHVEKEIEQLAREARSYLVDRKSAHKHVEEFRKCFLNMGAVLVELQIFNAQTKDSMNRVLESCLKSDWGYSFLFELGLSLHQGDETDDEGMKIVAQRVLAEFSHFKEVMTMVWNQETSQKPVEDTVAHISGETRDNGASTAIEVEEEVLLARYRAFEAEYNTLLGEYLSQEADRGKLTRKTVSLADTLKPITCSTIWDNPTKDKVTRILAAVFALFTILKSGDSFARIQGTTEGIEIGANILMKPHNIQVLTLLQLLGCGSAAGSALESQLMQIRTGEGKSMVLGAAAATLGLLGFKVRCVCYSEYLSARDYALFEQIFDKLGLINDICYSKITKLSEDSTARKGDLRGLTQTMIEGQLHVPQPRPVGGLSLLQNNGAAHNPIDITTTTLDSRSINESGEVNENLEVAAGFPTRYSRKRESALQEEVLLVDEVDVFFGADFYGQTYNQVTELRRPEIEELLKLIWEHFSSGGRKQRLVDVQGTPPYQSLIGAMRSWQFLIDNEVRLMLDHVHRVSEEPYFLHPERDEIGYKVHDTVSYEVTYGYRTAFAYLKEAMHGNLKDTASTLKRVLFMPVSCGQFSYANISPTRILGVSGTLQSMEEPEKDVLEQYGVKKYVFVPSVYGPSNFVFDSAGDGIFIEKSTSDYYHRICEEILMRTKERRAVIVFFQDNTQLLKFKHCPNFARLGRQKEILTENMEPEDKDFVINKAATSGQVTLCSAVFGRGTDFFCKDDRVQNSGGVHVIQTFLSSEISEEVQIQGRTSRQGKVGSYQMVLLEADLVEVFGMASGAMENVPRKDRYAKLCTLRNSKRTLQWKEVNNDLALATARDRASHDYFDMLLAGRQADSAKLFEDLYLLIKKPPIPDVMAVDVAVLLDVTGSMTQHCHHAVKTLEDLLRGDDCITTKLKCQFPETEIKLRVGLLGYRDIDDGNDQFIETLFDGTEHFTEDLQSALTQAKAIASRPSGGHDLAEDHLGAINHCCSSWNGANDWSSPIKLILLFTDAPAHGLVPPQCASLPNVDDYNIRHPLGLTTASVSGEMATKGITLLMCSYNPLATALTESRLSEDYLDHAENAGQRHVKSIGMVRSPPASSMDTQTFMIGDHPSHIIFVLDESGSMEREWQGVVQSFQSFLARRREHQNETDLVSVVQFDGTARTTMQVQPIGSASRNLDYRGGGTQFAPAAVAAAQVAQLTPASHKTTVVFMSDGGTDHADANGAAATFADINNTVKQKQNGEELELHVIAFSGGADQQQLLAISRASSVGRVHMASDAVALNRTFCGIAAGGEEVSTILQEEIAKEIADAVSNTLSMEFLS